MAISKARAAAVSKVAVEWATKVSKAEQRAKRRDKAEILARKVYDEQEFFARIAVADMAYQVLRVTRSYLKGGELPPDWRSGKGARELTAKGLAKYDRRKLLQTTIRRAQQAGEFEYADNTRRITHMEYVTKRDARVRAEHRKKDRLVLPKGHPFIWANPTPSDPNCRCMWQARTKAWVTRQRNAGTLRETPPELRMVTHRNKTTGEVLVLPEGIAPGFHTDPSSPTAIEDYRKLLEARIRKVFEFEMQQGA